MGGKVIRVVGRAAWKQLIRESRVGTTDKVTPRPQCIEVSVTIGAEQEHGRKNKKGRCGILKVEQSRTLMTKSTAHSVLPGEDMSVTSSCSESSNMVVDIAKKELRRKEGN